MFIWTKSGEGLDSQTCSVSEKTEGGGCSGDRQSTRSILSIFLQASGVEESEIPVDGCFHVKSRCGCGEMKRCPRSTPVTPVLYQPEKIGLRRKVTWGD